MASTAYQHRCVVVLPHDHDDDYTKVLEPAVKAGGMMAERATAATSQRDKNVYASRSAMPMPF